jgi:hypothetical protein
VEGLMDFATLSRRMKGAQRARNVVTLMLGVSIAANLLLTWRISQENTQVVLIPSRVSDGMVARGAADVRYIEALSLDAVYAMYTVSPATIRYGRDVIERISAADVRRSGGRRRVGIVFCNTYYFCWSFRKIYYLCYCCCFSLFRRTCSLYSSFSCYAFLFSSCSNSASLSSYFFLY